MSGGTGSEAASRRRRRSRAALACIAVLLVLLACGAAARSASWASGTRTTTSRPPAASSGGALGQDSQTSRPVPIHRGGGTGVSIAAYLLTAFVLVLMLLGLLLVCDLLRLPARRHWVRSAVSSDAELEDGSWEPDERVLPDAVQVALREVTDQPDAREAVVRAWLLLGEAAATAGTARRPAESAREYARRLADAHRLPAPALERLAGLYREARFSDHEMHPEQRELARRELFALQTALADTVDIAEFR